MPQHNPERREFKGRSYKKGGERVNEIRERIKALRAATADRPCEVCGERGHVEEHHTPGERLMKPEQRFRVVYRLPVTGVEAVEFVNAPSLQEAIVKVVLAHENIEVLKAEATHDAR